MGEYRQIHGVKEQKKIARRLGKRIRSLRTAKGWSQEYLAQESGLSATYMGEIERGEANASLYSIVSVSAALKVKIAELFVEG